MSRIFVKTAARSHFCSLSLMHLTRTTYIASKQQQKTMDGCVCFLGLFDVCDCVLCAVDTQHGILTQHTHTHFCVLGGGGRWVRAIFQNTARPKLSATCMCARKCDSTMGSRNERVKANHRFEWEHHIDEGEDVPARKKESPPVKKTHADKGKNTVHYGVNDDNETSHEQMQRKGMGMEGRRIGQPPGGRSSICLQWD
eukprot:GEMP01072737.1.p1 GENE.GEMP01072737.1~~GEMP01072737.1.p1  ORF type:complete len:198 (+),score=31.38 GEMP01072737.1:314-907(+)